MSYVHDHSDTLMDSFGVAIFLEGEKSETFGDGKGQSGDVLLYEGLWNVTINPINDRPFRLITGILFFCHGQTFFGHFLGGKLDFF